MMATVSTSSSWIARHGKFWAFLTASKDPPLAILSAFMKKFGLRNGIIWANQGGELARSDEF
jgi:hypothetical protein